MRRSIRQTSAAPRREDAINGFNRKTFDSLKLILNLLKLELKQFVVSRRPAALCPGRLRKLFEINSRPAVSLRRPYSARRPP